MVGIAIADRHHLGVGQGGPTQEQRHPGQALGDEHGRVAAGEGLAEIGSPQIARLNRIGLCRKTPLQGDVGSGGGGERQGGTVHSAQRGLDVGQGHAVVLVAPDHRDRVGQVGNSQGLGGDQGDGERIGAVFIPRIVGRDPVTAIGQVVRRLAGAGGGDRLIEVGAGGRGNKCVPLSCGIDKPGLLVAYVATHRIDVILLWARSATSGGSMRSGWVMQRRLSGTIQGSRSPPIPTRLGNGD